MLSVFGGMAGSGKHLTDRAASGSWTDQNWAEEGMIVAGSSAKELQDLKGED